MAQAKVGNTVQVCLKGTLEDGTVFNKSHENKPIEFTIGENKVINGIEKTVCGMKEGEIKTVSLTPEEAYGQYDERLVKKVKKEQIPSAINPKLGMNLKINFKDGFSTNARIVNVSDDTVTLDANNPLAGKNVIFAMRLEKIVN